MSKPIKCEVIFDSSASALFAALTDAARFTETSGASAEIDAQPGGAFSCFGSMIVGRCIELVPGSRLVQAWRVANWDEGVYSVTRFDLEDAADGKTRLKFELSGFPAEHRDHLEQGWQDNYWAPQKNFLQA